MNTVKKTLKALVLLTLVITALFAISACGKKDKSEIYIVTEEEFKSAVKLDENGGIEKISIDKLEQADEENMITGEKYYAVAYVDGRKISQGWFSFRDDVTVSENEIYIGTKKEFPIEMSVAYPRKNNPEISGLADTQIIIEPSEYKKTDYYIAAGFIANNAEKERFGVDFQFYEGSSNRSFDTHKNILYKKQITAAPSIKYLSYADYLTGKYDENLKDSIEVAPRQKCYAVIDYSLSSFKDIAETDTATLDIAVTHETGAAFTVKVEEFPTGDYDERETGASAAFKLREGARQRFIISVTSESAGRINVSAKISGDKISVLSAPSVSGSFNVNANIVVESKLAYELSSDQTYYIVTGFGDEQEDVIIIPATHKGLPVKEIKSKAFFENAYIKAVALPEGLTKIEAEAFRGCTGITSIIIPSSVTEIGNDAFADCGSINIYCEAEGKPIGWSDTWADSNSTVTWNYGKE